MNSDNNVATQIEQIRTMIAEHVSAIVLSAPSPTALNSAIKQAYDAGIPVVTWVSPVTSPYAVNDDLNLYQAGLQTMKGLVGILHGKGNIITVQGPAGQIGTTELQTGEAAVVKTCPGIQVIDDVYGDWLESTGETVTLQALTTHPQKVDAIWDSGSMFVGIMSALKSAGRPAVPVTDTDPNIDTLAYWHAHPGYNTVSAQNPPGAGVDSDFRIAIALLMGAVPR